MDQSRRGFFKAIAAVSAGAAVAAGAAVIPAAALRVTLAPVAPVASDAEEAYQFVVSQLRYAEAEFITRHYEPVVYESLL